MTNLGKVLKQIRLEHGEILKNMSDALGVTSSYLSAVETGKRPMPEEWTGILKGVYNLTEETLTKVSNAADELRKSIKVDIEAASNAKKEAAIVFARSFNEMDDVTAKSIKKMLEKWG